MVPDIGAWAPDGKQVLGNHWNRGGLNYHQIFTWSVHELSPHCACKHQVLASGWEHGNTWEHVYLNGYLWHFNVGYDIWVLVFTNCNRVRDVLRWRDTGENLSLGDKYLFRQVFVESDSALLLPDAAPLPSLRPLPKGDIHRGTWTIIPWASSQCPSVQHLLVELGRRTGLGSRMKQDLFDSNSTSYHQLTPNVQMWQSPRPSVRRKQERVMWEHPPWQVGTSSAYLALSIIRERRAWTCPPSMGVPSQCTVVLLTVFWSLTHDIGLLSKGGVRKEWEKGDFLDCVVGREAWPYPQWSRTMEKLIWS